MIKNNYIKPLTEKVELSLNSPIAIPGVGGEVPINGSAKASNDTANENNFFDEEEQEPEWGSLWEDDWKY